MSIAGLISKVKSSPILYTLYFHVGGKFVNILKKFLKADERLILFVSYGGRKYDDSPKDIYEAMLKDHRFDNYKKIWAFRDPESWEVVSSNKIKIDTLNYYKTALKARVWITNVGITRALSFSGINTISINTWHGSAIKYIGTDAIGESVFASKDGPEKPDYMLAQGNHDVEVFSRAFSLEKDKIALTGLPRNDSLVTYNSSKYINDLKEKLSIPIDKKVILYAPTYRDYEKDAGGAWVMKSPINVERWQKELSDKYVLLIRAHFAVLKVMNIQENGFVKNVTFYPSLNDLLLVTDLLITDYSSILFDFSILGRPILCYTYDYEKYKEERGMYMDIRTMLTSAQDEDQLLNIIQTIDWDTETGKARIFRDRYIQKYGNSSERVLDLLAENLGN